MKILDDIIGSIKRDEKVDEVIRGFHFTAVISRNLGIAATVLGKSDLEHDHSDKGEKEKEFLSDNTALELANYIYSENTAKASIGLAAINSLIGVNPEKCADIDGLKLIQEKGIGKNISVIGHFPYLQSLSNIAKNLWIIEKQPKEGDFPEEKNIDLLPQSDIVVITSTALTNHSINGILDLCKKGSLKMLLGPSTPMTEVLFDHGIDILSGSIVTNKDIFLKHLGEGSNFVRIRKSGAARFITMLKNSKI